MRKKRQSYFMLPVLAIILVAVLGNLASATGWGVDVTFETGALPSDFGMAAGGAVSPASHVSGGVWSVDLAAGDSSHWLDTSASLISNVTGTTLYGFAEIDQATLTSSADDTTIMGLGTDLLGAFAFTLGLTDGGMAGTTNNNYAVAVANDDGGKHTYGWEVDLTANKLKLFFDDVQVGEANGYGLGGNVFGAEMAYIGDASGGSAHSEVWDRWVMAEGNYPVVPEPSMLALFGIGAAMLGICRFRKR